MGMQLSEYQAKREELDRKMEELNSQEAEKKMELSIKYQAQCKKIQSQIGNLKRQQKEALKQYQNDKAWWHEKYKGEKHKINASMHTLRLEYLTVNGLTDDRIKINTPPTSTPPTSTPPTSGEGQHELNTTEV